MVTERSEERARHVFGHIRCYSVLRYRPARRIERKLSPSLGQSITT